MAGENPFNEFAQLSPVDLSNTQKVLRVLSIQSTPQILKAGDAQDLAAADLELVTDFQGPWRATVIGIKFSTMVNGVETPFGDTKDFVVYLVMGNEEFPLIERYNYRGVAATLTDHIELGAGDQVKVWASNANCIAKAQIRGVKL